MAQITYRFKDSQKEFIIRIPEKVGFTGAASRRRCGCYCSPGVFGRGSPNLRLSRFGALGFRVLFGVPSPPLWDAFTRVQWKPDLDMFRTLAPESTETGEGAGNCVSLCPKPQTLNPKLLNPEPLNPKPLNLLNPHVKSPEPEIPALKASGP